MSMKDMSVREMLAALVNCESVTPSGGGSLDLVGDFLRAAGFEVMRLPRGEVDNLFAYCGGRVELLFAGHTDVVPPGDLAQWATPPFVASERDGYLFGRGAADMKSGVAAMTVAAARAAADGVGVFLTTDEEGPAVDGTRHFVEWWRRQGRGQIRYCIVGEPTCERRFGDAIKIGRRGSLTARVTVVGRQTHVAYPHQGDNPAHRLVAALERIGRRWRANEARAAAGEIVTTYQLVELRGGVGADNVTPPSVYAVFNFRYAAEDSEADLKAFVGGVLDEAAGGQWECEWEGGAAPFLMSADGELVRVLREAIGAETGGVVPDCNARGGTSDGRFLKDICGQTVEFGVLNETIHAPNERVRIADVESLARIYEAVIARLVAG